MWFFKLIALIDKLVGLLEWAARLIKNGFIKFKKKKLEKTKKRIKDDIKNRDAQSLGDNIRKL